MCSTSIPKVSISRLLLRRCEKESSLRAYRGFNGSVTCKKYSALLWRTMRLTKALGASEQNRAQPGICIRGTLLYLSLGETQIATEHLRKAAISPSYTCFREQIEAELSSLK